MTTTDFSTSPSTADRDQLAVRHLPLVAHLVRETMARVPSAVDRHDLDAVALLGLLAAARDFDPARARSFSDHASIHVRGALVEELRSIDWSARAVCPRDRATARARLETVLFRFPDPVAAAAALGVEAEPRPATSGTRVDRPAPHVVGARVQTLADALEKLPPRLQQVVRGYFIDQRPMSEIAAELELSEDRVAELRTQALVVLRDALAPLPTESADAPDAQATLAGSVRRRLAATRTSAVQYAAHRAMGSESPERLETSA